MRNSCFIILLFSVLCLNAEVYVPSDVPNPKNQYSNGWICDPDHYLYADDATKIDAICSTLKKEVDVEMAVVLLSDIDQWRYDAFDFCQELFNLWGIGGAEKNTGVMVFFCEQSRDIRIHTGGGVEGLLPDVKCDVIIEHSLADLSAGIYSGAILNICQEIQDALLTNEAKAELLLGYKVRTNAVSDVLSWYLTIGIILLVLLCIFIRKKVPHTMDKISLSKREQIIDDVKKTKTLSGLLSCIFPLPILFAYVYMRRKSNQVISMPVACPICGSTMNQIQETYLSQYLNKKQLTEQSLQSVAYQVWHCDTCNDTEILNKKGARSAMFERCTQCGAKADMLQQNTTIQAATAYRSGLGRRDYRCMCCNHVHSIEYTIPKIVYVSNSSSSSSRGFGGGSSGGSWGGGSSFGGGAGRKF